MGSELDRAWRAWRAGVVRPRLAAVSVLWLFVAALLGAGAVDGETHARVVLIGAAYALVGTLFSLPRRTAWWRFAAFVTSFAIAQYLLATAPPGMEDVPVRVVVLGRTFHGAHEGVTLFLGLLVAAEAAGAWVTRPRRSPWSTAGDWSRGAPVDGQGSS